MDLPALELWYAALREEIGVIVPTNDPHRLQQKLYAVRRTAGDPDLDKLMLIIPASGDELCIAHKSAIEDKDA